MANEIKNPYRCPVCKKIVLREDTKKWRKGFCLKTLKSVRMILQPADVDAPAPPKTP